MDYIKGTDRHQIQLVCLDDMVDQKARVRIIDRFVDSIDLSELGFTNTVLNARGRCPYSPALMVKLYMFGYEKGIRSSRKLEALCHTDMEAMWLTEDLKPDFKTIANFRRGNADPFVCLFEKFADFLDSLGLYGKKTVAIDGTKIKASNSRKRHFTKRKLRALIEYNETKAQEYLGILDEGDGIRACGQTAGADPEDKLLQTKIENHIERADAYRMIYDELEEAGSEAVSLTDHDAHMMSAANFGQDMAYNVQVAVDGKEHLVGTFALSTKATDYDQLYSMARKTRDERGADDTVFLADKGYWSSEELGKCEKDRLNVVVAAQKIAQRKDSDARFSMESFIYDPETDSYLCPAGHHLTNHSKKTTATKAYHNTKACRTCAYRDDCVPRNSNKRSLRRREGSDVLDRAREKYSENNRLYKQRQQIVEHVFGTIKRTMHSGYLLLRTKVRVMAEMALVLTGYNLKRVCVILSFDDIMAGLEEYAQGNGCSQCIVCYL